tara:strand:+ start:776 stop:1057 length:282 start_codon:yes stop_codon:yes gene_type:complete
MSFSSKTSGICKAIRISLVSKLKDATCVTLTLQNVEHKYVFKLKFFINTDKDTPQSIIDEMKNDALITISNPTECAKLLEIFFSKSSTGSPCK